MGLHPLVHLPVTVDLVATVQGLCQSLSAKRRLIRKTVRSVTSIAAATWDALQPSSIFSNTRARVLTWAELRPDRTTLRRCPLSSDVSLT